MHTIAKFRGHISGKHYVQTILFVLDLYFQYYKTLYRKLMFGSRRNQKSTSTR